MTGMTDREIVERLRTENSALFLPVALSAAEAIERLIETTDTQELHLGEFELGFRDLESNNRDLEEQVERLIKERDEAVEALKAYANDCSNDECEFCIRARSILSKYEAKP